jgi:hypothetical protein
MKAQGWCRDPYLVHEDRYFSDGQPTKLVRDGGKVPSARAMRASGFVTGILPTSAMPGSKRSACR